MSKTRTENDAPYHKYFTQMLNIAEDELDPFQYRLLAHYIRWTGHGGECDKSIRATAKATKMGVNKVRSSLNELVALGYITVERPTPQEARNGKTIHITILDRWMDNISKYQGVSEKTQPVSNVIQDSTKPVSNSIHTPVSNQIRIEEQHTEEHTQDSSRKRERKAKADTIPAPQMNAMKDAIVLAFGWNSEHMTRSEWGIIQKAAKELCTAGFESERVVSYHAWCKAKFTKGFTPAALTVHLSEYRASRLETQPTSTMTDKERWASIPELKGITEIIT